MGEVKITPFTGNAAHTNEKRSRHKTTTERNYKPLITSDVYTFSIYTYNVDAHLAEALIQPCKWISFMKRHTYVSLQL